MPSFPAPLRETMRALRRAVPPAERHHSAQQLAKRILALRIFTTSHSIAGYLPFDGEINPTPLLKRALEMEKQVYLPVLTNLKAPMKFAPYHADTVLQPNRFGIPEPQVRPEELLAPQCLDLVLTPLVAFDASGTRLGMGGGFYDRTFAFLNHPNRLPRPYLLGLAYEIQKVEHLTRQPWDVPLIGIVTECALYPCKSDCLLE